MSFRRHLLPALAVLLSLIPAACSAKAGEPAEPAQQRTAALPAEPPQQRTAALPAVTSPTAAPAPPPAASLPLVANFGGLLDLTALRRAEAALDAGDQAEARLELGKPEVLSSTNRLLLERAGKLAERAGDEGLAAELYARGARYFGWTVERSRMMDAAAASFARAGRTDEAIEQYRALVETFGWTKVAQDAGPLLDRLGGLTSYHRGLLALASGRHDAARDAFTEAAGAGDHAPAATDQLRRIDEAAAWRAAEQIGTSDGYRSFLSAYPSGTYAAEARFQEGLAHYQAGRFARSLDVWETAAARVRGDDMARLRLWAGKALVQLGRDGEARAQWEDAARAHPAGYYALRARDRLAGSRGWPKGAGTPVASTDDDWPAAERWLAAWATPSARGIADEERARRGLGLLDLGLPAEAEAEFNGLIAESQDAVFLLQLARRLLERDVWVSASRAATRLISLSPARVVSEAPAALQRLVYPIAYPDLVGPLSERRSLDPLLLLSVIHQESRYDPFALSLADARGLTQVIPSTGRLIGSKLGRSDFTPDDLYQPAVALEFGSWYLSGRLAAFGGDVFRALASYNAGDRPLARWAADDPDLFVERIDYPETKSYVRQIYLHHAIYRELVGSEK